jgi:hypothetical protein
MGENPHGPRPPVPDQPEPGKPAPKRYNYASFNKEGVLVLGGQDYTWGWLRLDSQAIEAGRPSKVEYIPQFMGEDGQPVDPQPGGLEDEIRFSGEGARLKLQGIMKVSPKEGR